MPLQGSWEDDLPFDEKEDAFLWSAPADVVQTEEDDRCPVEEAGLTHRS